MLIGEFCNYSNKGNWKIINSIISIFPSIYLSDIIFEAFAFTAIGRGIGVAFIILFQYYSLENLQN